MTKSKTVAKIDERLLGDSEYLLDLPLCQVRLMKEMELPWALLIPLRDNIKEIFHLHEEDRLQLFREVNLVSRCLSELFRPEKINIGLLGNKVAQLHVHIIGRFKNDRNWPEAIWGTKDNLPFEEAFFQERLQRIRAWLDRVEEIKST